MRKPKKLADIFRKTYNGYIAKNTMLAYTRVLEQIESDKLIITSKSKYLQAKAALKKCREVGIVVNYSLPKWSKRGGNIKKNIIDKTINKEQLQTILENCPYTNRGNELRLAVKIAYYSGLREEETLKLKGNDVIINNHIKLNIHGKGGKFRISYLPLFMRAELKAFSGFSINRDYLVTTLKRVSTKTGINFSFHSLRHSFATNMLNNSVPIQDVSCLLGHSDIKTTAIYLHASQTVSEKMRSLGY